MVKSAAKHHHDEAPQEAAVEEAHELHLEPVDDEGESEVSEDESNLIATVATVGVVGIGAALVEAALLPGVILGVAAVAFPQLAPKIGSALGPIFKSTVRGLYRMGQKTRELVAETQEHVQDIVAEVDAEGKAAAAAKESVTEKGAPLQ
jgi:hypothetical protein